jgi:hypothetical protein
MQRTQNTENQMQSDDSRKNAKDADCHFDFSPVRKSRTDLEAKRWKPFDH